MQLPSANWVAKHTMGVDSDVPPGISPMAALMRKHSIYKDAIIAARNDGRMMCQQTVMTQIYQGDGKKLAVAEKKAQRAATKLNLNSRATLRKTSSIKIASTNVMLVKTLVGLAKPSQKKTPKKLVFAGDGSDGHRKVLQRLSEQKRCFAYYT